MVGLAPTDVDYWRQLGIVAPQELQFPITIIGAGGIGSPTTLLLAKMGCSNITVWDNDTVEAHNFPNQLFRLEDCGSSKVVSLADIVSSFTGTQIAVRQERYEAQDLRGVVIVCVDNMSTRHDVWKRVKLNLRVPLFIDARMGGQEAQVYAFKPTVPDKIKAYEACLYTDEQALEIACTEQAILYNTFMIASLIGSIIKSHAKRQDLPLNGVVKLADTANLMLY